MRRPKDDVRHKVQPPDDGKVEPIRVLAVGHFLVEIHDQRRIEAEGDQSRHDDREERDGIAP
jgi:hypothetical protein